MTAVSPEGRPERVVLGALLIVVAVFLMSLQDAVIKYASSDLPLWQIYVLRGLLAVPALLALAARERAAGTRSYRPGRWCLLRATLLVAMYICLYAAVPVLSLATIAAAFYTGPLFITLLSALLIGEPVGRRGWLGIALGFAGVLVILQPGSDAFQALVLLPVLSALFYALAAVVTRSRCRDDSPVALAIGLNLTLLAVGLFAGLAITLWQPAESTAYPFLLGTSVAMAPLDWGLVVLLSALIVGIGLTLAAAYQVAPPATVATFDYSYLIFAVLWSYLFFAELPEGPTLTGMAMIAGAGFLVLRR